MFNFHFSIFNFYFWNGDWILRSISVVVNKNYAETKKSLRYFVRNCLENFPLLPISLRIHVNSESFLFWKKIIKSFKKYYAAAKRLFLVSNLPLNIKYEIVLFEQCQMKPYIISPLLWISNLAVQQAFKKGFKKANFQLVWTKLWREHCFLGQYY